MKQDLAFPGRLPSVSAIARRGAARASSDDAVLITLLGGFSVARGGRLLPLASRKAQGLLAVLAIGGSPTASREALCGLLWSESGEEKARASLRQAIHALKWALDEGARDLLQVGRDAVGLGGPWTSDVPEILGRLGTGEIDARLLGSRRLVDGLLTGFEDLDPAFGVWLVVQRQSIQNQLTRGLERILASGAPYGQRDAAAALLSLDPTHEEACRHAMRDAAERGDVAAALKTYKRLWDLLDEEYDTEPSELTQALVVKIKNGEIPVRPDLGAPPEPSRAPPPLLRAPQPSFDDHPYLVVCPFEDHGVGEHFAHIAGGLRHELIAKLVRFREWSVVDGSAPTLDIASLPGRSVSIQATLRQAGAKLSLTLTTKEQPTGRYIWSESFAVAPERWFDIEPDLLRRIAVAVNVQITTERLARFAVTGNVSRGAYERWLRGQDVMTSFRADKWETSELIYRSIVDDVPEFAPAYSALAQLRNSRHLVFPGSKRAPESLEEAVSYAMRAVQIDPLDSRGHLAQGWALAFKGRWHRAKLSLELALRLNENDPWTLTSAALALAFCGEHDAAVELADQALTLIPHPPRVHWAYQATLRFICSDYAGSVEAAEQAEDAIPNLPGWHAAALAHLGEDAAARERVEAFLAAIRARWVGAQPDETKIYAWFLHAFPIKLDADRARLREGLLQAAGVSAHSDMQVDLDGPAPPKSDLRLLS